MNTNAGSFIRCVHCEKLLNRIGAVQECDASDDDSSTTADHITFMTELKIYNSYSRQKEVFKSITPGHVGMYVCGPTVSGESHLGHARPYITFDVIYRYLMHLGNKVRYVRNITDAGHFEEEGREAEDKISKKAVREKLEPM